MVKKSKKGDLALIEKIMLAPKERTANIPAETKKVPFVMRVKGTLIKGAGIGKTAEVITVIGRKFKGKLIEINPGYKHGFGEPVKELQKIRNSLRGS